MKLSHEPALAAGALGAALSLAVAYGLMDAEKATLWGVLIPGLIPLAQGWVTRHFVMPVSKIEDAGVNPDAIAHRAEVANGGS